jgi:hypothetical protein
LQRVLPERDRNRFRFHLPFSRSDEKRIRRRHHGAGAASQSTGTQSYVVPRLLTCPKPGNAMCAAPTTWPTRTSAFGNTADAVSAQTLTTMLNIVRRQAFACMDPACRICFCITFLWIVSRVKKAYDDASVTVANFY